MSFRLVPNSVTLDDLERRNSPNGRVFSQNSVAFILRPTLCKTLLCDTIQCDSNTKWQNFYKTIFYKYDLAYSAQTQH